MITQKNSLISHTPIQTFLHKLFNKAETILLFTHNNTSKIPLSNNITGHYKWLNKDINQLITSNNLLHNKTISFRLFLI